MLSRIKNCGILAVFISSLILPAVLHAAEFNSSQRKEMGEFVRQFLIENPEVLRDAFEALERKEAKVKADRVKTAIKELAPDIYRADGDLVVGNPVGDVTIVEFFDYNCGFCKRALPDVLKLVAIDKNLKFVIKEFPILGPGSLVAARAAIASRAQGKYWEFHTALLKKRGSVNEAGVMQVAKTIGLDIDKLKKDMNSEKIADILRRNHKVAQALNINGTPAFIVADNIFPGAVGYEQLAESIAKVRAKGGCTIC